MVSLFDGSRIAVWAGISRWRVMAVGSLSSGDGNCSPVRTSRGGCLFTTVLALLGPCPSLPCNGTVTLRSNCRLACDSVTGGEWETRAVTFSSALFHRRHWRCMWGRQTLPITLSELELQEVEWPVQGYSESLTSSAVAVLCCCFKEALGLFVFGLEISKAHTMI